MDFPDRVINIYEINTRQWLHALSLEKGQKVTLQQIPVSFWEKLKQIGIDLVWLMGVWQTTPSSIPAYCFEPGLKSSYSEVLPDWRPEDVGGSPYAIDDYRISPSVGDENQLKWLKKTLNDRNIKLILDFIPNHFNAHTSLLLKHPDIFISGDQNDHARRPSIFYKRGEQYWAHGKDPYFPAWTDTVQVNYFKQEARSFMKDCLLKLGGICDGVRCDMAMLAINRIFYDNWSSMSSAPKGFTHQPEFWEDTINKVKQDFPQFIFIAEVYWDLEDEMQQLGFDYTYDKRLLDNLRKGNITEIRNHLQTGLIYQWRLTRFLENHDEPRMTSSLPMERVQAAAVITYTVPGARLFYHGQLEGSRKKIPVQLLRTPVETPCPCPLRSAIKSADEIVCACQASFYQKLMPIVTKEAFRKGEWELIPGAVPGNSILSWKWTWKEKNYLVVINYSEKSVKAKIAFETNGGVEGIDLLNESTIALNIDHGMLSIDLPPYKSRILEICK